MDHIFEHYKKTGYLHHAYIFEGDFEILGGILTDSLTKYLGITCKGNPDVVIAQYESFGIDEARNISERQSRRGVSEILGNNGIARKFFILGAKSFTREAQNALLKTSEEPTEGTHFFMVVPRHDTILPTLKSRVILVKPQQETRAGFDKTKELAIKFLDSSLEERFALVKKLTETKKGETADREKIHALLDHIEQILYTRTAGKPSGDIFREIYQTKTYLSDRGSSPKMLLDNLAIVLFAVIK